MLIDQFILNVTATDGAGNKAEQIVEIALNPLLTLDLPRPPTKR